MSVAFHTGQGRGKKRGHGAAGRGDHTGENHLHPPWEPPSTHLLKVTGLHL